MSLPFNARRVAVVAPHPDDEILGCGGTMARAAAAGAEVHVVVVTRGQPPLFDEELVPRIRSEPLQAHGTLGVADPRFLDFPAAGLDQGRRSALNAAPSDAVSATRPEGRPGG